MCGVAGFLGAGGDNQRQEQRIGAMIEVLAHRGPDARGSWCSSDGSASLGHTRLAIQDISDLGAQPMESHSGRFVICYNGEVYNFPDIAAELRKLGHAFRGHSDTEVMLAAIEEWGVDRALQRFIGMFAFALWDRKREELYLVRDRLGIKPLYYRETGDGLVFASELKAIEAFDKGGAELDRRSIALFLRHSCVPAPCTIFARTWKLLPGHILTASRKGAGGVRYQSRPYWQPSDSVTKPEKATDGDYQETVGLLRDLLRKAVSERMIADVPLGAFLSGGIDSSLVVALMQEAGDAPVETYTIGFGEDSHNESAWARRVAESLGTNHHERQVTAEDALAVIPDLASIYDEPFADASQIPTILVSRFARRDVTVCLSGDGGDELFAGYGRYAATKATWNSIRWMPYPIRRMAASLLAPLSGPLSGIVDPVFGRIYDSHGVAGNRGDELQRVAAVLRQRDRAQLYEYMRSHWKTGAGLVRGLGDEPATLLSKPPDWFSESTFEDYMMRADLCTYLPDDILTKVDRASMSCSLEVRVPLLDHRVVEAALGIPLQQKTRDGRGKSPLRDILSGYLPDELINRPKMGFAVPIDEWLRGPLREWASDLLTEHRIREDGYIEPSPVLARWRQHQSGERNWGGHLWDILMFQSWLRQRG